MPRGPGAEFLRSQNQDSLTDLVNGLAGFYCSQGITIDPLHAELQQLSALEYVEASGLLTPIHPDDRGDFVERAQERAIQTVIKLER